MPTVWDLAKPVDRARLDAEAEEAAKPMFEPHRFNVVDTCPSCKLADLVAEHPELLDEVIRRRGGELQQL